MQAVEWGGICSVIKYVLGMDKAEFKTQHHKKATWEYMGWETPGILLPTVQSVLHKECKHWPGIVAHTLISSSVESSKPAWNFSETKGGGGTVDVAQ